MKACCLFLLVNCLFAIESFSQERSLPAQQSELQRLKKEIESTNRRVDSLERLQQSIQKRVLDVDQRISSDERVIKRLGDQIRSIDKQTQAAKSKLTERQLLLSNMRQRYLGTIRELYTSSRSSRPPLVAAPNDELVALRQIRYLKAITAHDSSTVTAVADLLSESESSLSELSSKQSDISRLKKRRESGLVRGQAQKEKSEQDLQKARRKRLAETDKLMALQRSIEEMERIVARLETERKAAPPPVPSGGVAFATLAGHLPMPLRGSITTGFGSSVDPTTKLKAFSPGIVITGRPADQIRAIADGIVAYAGELRGYGTFVIINHDGQYYSTYAGLGSLAVEQNQRISAGNMLGTSGTDGQLRFELRKGREAIDPIPWLNVDKL